MENEITYLPVFEKSQYTRLLSLVKDKENFKESWEEWYEGIQQFKEEMKTKGFSCMEVLVDVEELHNYCVLNDLENNRSTRELFTLKLVSGLQ
jgi:hypothetical protein